MKTLLPGSTLGVLGGGQLGRMFASAAQRLGYRVAVYSESPQDPAARVADLHYAGQLEDPTPVTEFAEQVDAITFEFENVPRATLETAAEGAPLRPSLHLLHTTQHRIREKTGLRDLGLPVAPFAAIEQSSDLGPATERIDSAGVLKTSAWGYDGKGQVRVASPAELRSAWEQLDSAPAVLEAWVPFELEISVVGARGYDGEVALYDPIENHHENHILDHSIWPARIRPEVAERAREIARAVLEGFEVVGVIAVEMFVLPDGQVWINEIAPRPHNSGHLTIDAHSCSQFEQQVRAVCGLPLGSVTASHPAASMANLLGDLWSKGTPNWPRALGSQGLHLHLYGKDEPRPGRKMGHLTAVATDTEQAKQIALDGRRALGATASADPAR